MSVGADGGDMEILQKSLKKNAFLNVVKTLMGLLFPLITFPYASRILLPDGIGKVNFAQTIVGYFVMFAMLGVSNYGMREVAKVRNDKRQLSKLVKEILKINFISSFVSYILLFLLIFFVPSFFNYRKLIILLSSTIIFTVLGIDWLFYALEELFTVTLRLIIFQGISLILLFLFVKSKDDCVNYALITVFSSVGSNVLAFFYSRKFVDYSVKENLEIRKHIKPIFIFFVMAISGMINSSLDITMLGLISGDTQVGFYSASLKIIKIVTSVATATTIILPRLSFFYKQGNFEEVKNIVCKTFNANIVFVIPAIFGVFLCSKSIILVLSGDSYIDSITITKILSPSILFLALTNLTGAHLFIALNKEKFVIYSVFIGMIFNIVCNFIFIPKYGAIGAAIATCITEFVVMSIQLFIAKNYIKISKIYKNFFQCVFATFFMNVCVYFVQKINTEIIFSLISSILTGVVVYSIALVLMKNEFVLSVLRRKRK